MLSMWGRIYNTTSHYHSYNIITSVIIIIIIVIITDTIICYLSLVSIYVSIIVPLL